MIPPFNYHTHTTRCKHATGTDREYIETAIEAGFQILGFSDHCPWVYKSDYVATMRMTPNEVDGYFHSLEDLRQEYKKDIQIFIGFESEYFPELMEGQDKLLSDFPVDYMILGQHFLGSDEYGMYVGMPVRSDELLTQYVDTVIEGAKTGRYLYVAHPDLIHYHGNRTLYKKEMVRLCTALKELEIPLEINLLGAADGRNYPDDTFWDIARKIGNPCIVGFDAHSPNQLINEHGRKQVEKLLKKHRLTLSEEPPLGNLN